MTFMSALFCLCCLSTEARLALGLSCHPVGLTKFRTKGGQFRGIHADDRPDADLQKQDLFRLNGTKQDEIIFLHSCNMRSPERPYIV